MGIHCKNQIRASRSKQSTFTGRALQKVNSCLRVKEIDPFEVSALQKLNLPQVTEIDLHKKSTIKIKFASRSTKSTFIRRALQKLNLPQGHQNRPSQRRHPQRGRNKIKRRA